MKNVLVVIPARGGSKGVPRKNLRVVHERTLTEWAIRSAQTFHECMPTRVVLSSDDSEILLEAKKYPDVLASRRPIELSTDTTPDFEVLRYELLNSEKIFELNFNYVIMLQPTSPVRNSGDLWTCLEMLEKRDFSAAWTVNEVPLKFHPRKQLRPDHGFIRPYLETPLVLGRQELDSTLIRNGACYAMTREVVLTDERLMGNKCAFIKCSEITYNIDSEGDLMEVISDTIVEDGILKARTKS